MNQPTAAMSPVAVVAALLALSAFASATEYVVGDHVGWSVGFDYDEWAEGKTFRVGDTLVFNYLQGSDVVVIVNGAGFGSCKASPNMGVLASGSDRITLTTTGNKWYISGVSSNCDYGQKLKITVLPKTTVGSLAPAPKPWFPVPVFPLPPNLPPSAETPGISRGWPWAPASSPSSSSSAMSESHRCQDSPEFPPRTPAPSLPPTAETPGFPFPWPTIPSLPPNAETPGFPFPWPFPPSPSVQSTAEALDSLASDVYETEVLTMVEAPRISLAPNPSPLPKWGWYNPVPSPAPAA